MSYLTEEEKAAGVRWSNLSPEEKQLRRERESMRWNAEQEAERQREAAALADELARRELYPVWLRTWANENYKLQSAQELAELVNWVVVVLFACNVYLVGKLTIKKIHPLLKNHPAIKNESFTAERFYQRLGQLLTGQGLIDKKQPAVGYVIRPEALPFFQVLQITK